MPGNAGPRQIASELNVFSMRELHQHGLPSMKKMRDMHVLGVGKYVIRIHSGLGDSVCCTLGRYPSKFGSSISFPALELRTISHAAVEHPQKFFATLWQMIVELWSYVAARILKINVLGDRSAPLCSKNSRGVVASTTYK